jgi:hypothetical protein
MVLFAQNFHRTVEEWIWEQSAATSIANLVSDG